MAGLFDQIHSTITRREHELSGLWERYGDAFEGCTVLVDEEEGRLIGTLTQLPGKMGQFGWAVGDIKWRAIRRIGKNRYGIQDLFKEIDAATRSISAMTYQPAGIRLVSAGELVLRCSPEAPSPFPTQHWRKIGRISHNSGV